MKRTPLKRSQAPLKKTLLNKISKKNVKNYKKKKEEDIKKYTAFYNEIWNERYHDCKSCGTYLGEIPRTYHFDHILEKSSHPSFAFIEENIALLCLSCHYAKTNGNPTEKYQQIINNTKKLLLNDN